MLKVAVNVSMLCRINDCVPNISGTVDHIKIFCTQVKSNDISRCFSLFFEKKKKKKYKIANIVKLLYFLLTTSTNLDLLLRNRCISGSSINAKQIFRCVPHTKSF